MRLVTAWGVGAALLLGAGSALADPGTDTSTSGNWFTRWFHPAAKPANKDTPPKLKKEDMDKLSAAGQATAVEGAANQRKHEEVKYFRRWEVCNKLRDIADQTDDTSLRHKADQMEERAWAVYIERTHFLPSGGAGAEPELKIGERNHAQAAPGAGRAGADLINAPSGKGHYPAREE
jgi:hypothetical protein